MNQATPDGPLPAYRQLRRSGKLSPAPAQELAVEKLQMLHMHLKHYHAPGADGDEGGVFARFFARGGRRREPPPQGIYIFGDVGRGKSMVMDLFFATAPVATKRRVHFHAFMVDVHAAAHVFRQTPKDRRHGDDPIPPIAAHWAAEASLLCFDEFQVTDVADAMILGRLFTELFRLGVVVVATSNRPPDELYQGGLNRELFLPFIQLFKDRLDLLHLAGAIDYRMARLSRMAVYYTPLGAAAEAAIDTAFVAITEGEPAGPVRFEVQGRDICVPLAAVGVARASFAELCERPLGAADYLELARCFHTLVLSSVPAMTAARRNAAKRFGTLIDALYEHRVKLICSAEAPPERLYPAGDGSFEFQRTASRLIEMQTREYLAEPHALRGQ